MLIAYLASDKTLKGTAEMLQNYGSSDIYLFNKLRTAESNLKDNKKSRLDSTSSPEERLRKFKNS